jgi:hypothetical protein
MPLAMLNAGKRRHRPRLTARPSRPFCQRRNGASLRRPYGFAERRLSKPQWWSLCASTRTLKMGLRHCQNSWSKPHRLLDPKSVPPRGKPRIAEPQRIARLGLKTWLEEGIDSYYGIVHSVIRMHDKTQFIHDFFEPMDWSMRLKLFINYVATELEAMEKGKLTSAQLGTDLVPLVEGFEASYIAEPSLRNIPDAVHYLDEHDNQIDVEWAIAELHRAVATFTPDQ